MNPNIHSDQPADPLAALASAVDALAAQDLTGLPDAARAERVLGLRRLLDRLEGHWLKELADLDARGAAGADHGQPAPPPPAGCATGSTWAPPPPPRSAPPAPCSLVP